MKSYRRAVLELAAWCALASAIGCAVIAAIAAVTPY